MDQKNQEAIASAALGLISLACVGVALLMADRTMLYMTLTPMVAAFYEDAPVLAIILIMLWSEPWGIFAIPMAIMGVFFGVSARKNPDRQNYRLATAGLICSALGLVLFLIIYGVIASYMFMYKLV